MFAQLKGIEGDGRRVTVRLSGPRFLVGTGPGCHHRPRDCAVAARHCEFLVEAGRLAVRDLGSPGGTALNGLRMAPDVAARLRPGDRVRVGDSVFEVLAAADDLGGGHDPPAAAGAQRLLQRRVGPARPLSPREQALLGTRDVAGIPVHAIGMARVTDPTEAQTWRGLLRGLLGRTGPGRLVLDLRAVGACSEEAVDALLAFRWRLGAAGGAAKVCDVRPAVVRALEEAGADGAFPPYLDAADAVWSRW